MTGGGEGSTVVVGCCGDCVVVGFDGGGERIVVVGCCGDNVLVGCDGGGDNVFVGCDGGGEAGGGGGACPGIPTREMEPPFELGQTDGPGGTY